MKTNKIFFLLDTLLVALIFICGFYAIGGENLIGSDAVSKTSPLSPLAFFLLLGCFLLITAVFIFLISYRKVYKPSVTLIVGFLILFVTNMIAILIYKNGSIFLATNFDGSTGTFSFSIDAYDRFVDISQFFCVLTLSLIILDIIPQIFDFKVIYVFSLIAILVVTVCVIASFFIDNHIYIDLFFHLGKEDMYKFTATSFFAYRNSYGFVLYLGIIASLFMHHMNKKWYWFIVCGIFYLELWFVLCKTAIVLGFVVVMAYLLTRFFITYKENKKRNLIALVSIIFVLVLLCVAAIVFNRVLDHILTSDIDFETIKSRLIIWRNVIDILNSTNWIIGTGFHLFGDILFLFNTSDGPAYYYNDTQFAHNGILELLGNGGIVLLVAFILIIIWVVSKYVKHYEENKSLVLFELILVFVSFAYLIFESGTFVLPFSLDYSFLSILICVPAIMMDKNKDTNVVLTQHL